MAAEAAMSRVDYDVEGNPGRLYSMSAGEYAQVELYDAYFSVAWSTSFPVDKSLAELADLLPEASNEVGSGRLVVENSSGSDPISAAAALRNIVEEPTVVRAMRLEYTHFALTWRVAHETTAGRKSPAQIGLISDAYDPEHIVEMIHRTATAGVAYSADSIIRDADFVSGQVPNGFLLATQ